jgi:hypothetical protein
MLNEFLHFTEQKFFLSISLEHFKEISELQLRQFFLIFLKSDLNLLNCLFDQTPLLNRGVSFSS